MFATVLTPVAGDTSGPLDLLQQASGPAGAAAWILLAASVAAWTLIVVLLRQVQRWRGATSAFEAEATGSLRDPARVVALAGVHPLAPSAEIIRQLGEYGEDAGLLGARAELALSRQELRLGRGMTTLATIGATAPFVGLFGTVYGILEAFLRIGASGSTSLAVVAPAIGEALVVTAVGLFAAIPAVVGYNVIAREVDEVHARTRGFVQLWVEARRQGGQTRGG